jgi:ribonuclease HI
MKTHSYALFCDGASRGNPGLAAFGFVVYQLPEHETLDYEIIPKKGTEVLKASKFIGTSTNNQAEWQGLTFGLEKIRQTFGAEIDLRVFLDSQLVIKQVLGEYRVKDEGLKTWHRHCLQIIKKFNSVEFTHVLRKYNKVADKLANEAIDERDNS